MASCLLVTKSSPPSGGSEKLAPYTPVLYTISCQLHIQLHVVHQQQEQNPFRLAYGEILFNIIIIIIIIFDTGAEIRRLTGTQKNQSSLY